MNLNHRIKIIFTILTILVSILGGYLIFRATFWGPWAFSDSAAYLSAARNIQAGNGATILNSNGSFTPVTEFPPLFPVILSLFTPNEGYFLTTARWINVIFFALSIFTVGLLSFRAFNKILPSIFSSILIAISPLMVDTFSGFMSEPLFIGLLLLLVFLLFEFINSKNTFFLIPIFIISSFLPMVRYAGILFVFCISMCFYIFRKINPQRIFQLIPSYILVSLAPIGIWFFNQFSNLDKVGGKRLILNVNFVNNVFHSILQEFRVIEGWIPYSGIYSNKIINQALLFSFSGLFIISLFIGLSSSIKNRNNNTHKSLLLFQICLILFSAYVLFIGFTHNFTIPTIDIIDRMMVPIYPFLVLIFLCAFEILIIEKKRWFFGSVLLFIALISIRFYGLSAYKAVEVLNAEGKGYSSREYLQSEFVAKLNSLPLNQQLISNSAAFVLFYTNRFPLPVDQFHNRSYGSGKAYGEKTFRERNAALVILIPEFNNYYGEASDQLFQSITAGLRVDFLDEIGGIFYYPIKPIPQ